MDFCLSSSPTPLPTPYLPPSFPHALLQPHSAPTLSHLGAQYLVVITGSRLCRPKRVVIGPVAISLWVVSPVALLTGPAIAHSAFPTHVLLMHTGHQGPAATPRGHVTESLVDDTILSAEVIQAICRGNQSETLCLEHRVHLRPTTRKTLGNSEMYPEGSHKYRLLRTILCGH